mgnify:CR=1 FL=1
MILRVAEPHLLGHGESLGVRRTDPLRAELERSEVNPQFVGDRTAERRRRRHAL